MAWFKHLNRLRGVASLLLAGGCAATATAGTFSYQFERPDGSLVFVTSADPQADIVVGFKQLYTLIGEEYADDVTLPGVTITGEDGVSRSFGATAARPGLADDGGVAADDCATADAATTMPLAITGANLPYDKTFDATAATDNGDFRGANPDGLSGVGGKDAFWAFTPSVTGVYSIAMTAGGSAGVGVWSGSCGALVEERVAFNLFGGGTSNLAINLNGGTTYFIVWEDFFPGSVENSVRLRIEGPFFPQGETAASAVDLSGSHWGIGFSGEYDTSANANTLSQPGTCAEPSYGDGNDIWFKLPPVTESGTTHTLYAHAGTMTNSYFVLYSHAAVGETIANLVIEDCNADIGVSSEHGTENDFMSQIQFLGNPNRTYYLFVESENFSGPGGNGSFTLFGNGGTPKSESTIVENFYLGAGNIANFVYTGGVGETPQATLATPPAQRIDSGRSTGKWGGYATTGSQYMYSFAGASYLTDPSVLAGYFLLGSTPGDETGSYVYTYFHNTSIDLSYGDAELSFSLRYGSAAGTTTSLRILMRSNYNSGHGTPGTWLISEPITFTGLTGAFATTPIQHVNNLTQLDWFLVNAPSKTNLDSLEAGDAEPIVIGMQLPHGISLMLSDVNGLGIYINDNVKTGFTSGLIFDSIALTGIVADVPVTAVSDWSVYE